MAKLKYPSSPLELPLRVPESELQSRAHSRLIEDAAYIILDDELGCAADHSYFLILVALGNEIYDPML
jgi:hypothetical protein